MSEAPAIADRMCVRCGWIGVAATACARCGAERVPMRWHGAPARKNWFDAGLRAGLGASIWPIVAGFGAVSVAALSSGLFVGAAIAAGPVVGAAATRRNVHGFVLEQLTPAFGRWWHWVSEDGCGRGAMTTLGSRRVTGAGSWLDLIEELHVDVAPSAAEVVAAGPYAVARAMDEGAEGLPRLDPVHVLLLAAVAHEVARGAIRVWRAERLVWVQANPLVETRVEPGTSRSPLLTWARGRTAAPPSGTLERAVVDAVEAQTGRSGSALGPSDGARVPSSLGEPYRGIVVRPATPPPPAEMVELRSLAIGDLLRRDRSAPASPDSLSVAERLLALLNGSPFLAAHVISEAENVRILQGF